MNSILQGELASLLTDALEAERIPYPLAIRRTETDSSDPFNPSTTTVDYDARGWIDDYSEQDKAGTLIQVNDRKVFVLCSSLDPTPSTTDRLVMDGKSYTIVSVSRDPAGTCHVLQARV